MTVDLAIWLAVLYLCLSSIRDELKEIKEILKELERNKGAR